MDFVSDPLQRYLLSSVSTFFFLLLTNRMNTGKLMHYEKKFKGACWQNCRVVVLVVVLVLKSKGFF